MPSPSRQFPRRYLALQNFFPLCQVGRWKRSDALGMGWRPRHKTVRRVEPILHLQTLSRGTPAALYSYLEVLPGSQFGLLLGSAGAPYDATLRRRRNTFFPSPLNPSFFSSQSPFFTSKPRCRCTPFFAALFPSLPRAITRFAWPGQFHTLAFSPLSLVDHIGLVLHAQGSGLPGYK